MLKTAAAAALLLLVAGCADAQTPGAQTPGADRVKTTPKALAALAVEHTDIEPTSVEGSMDEGISASIRFGEHDHLLAVSTSEYDESAPAEPCGEADDRGTCKVINHDAGKVMLYWELEEPEEDPGIVVVGYRSSDSANAVVYAGDTIAGDPRDLDLSVSVEEMIAIVTDDRLGLTTTENLTQSTVPGYSEAPAEMTELSPQVLAATLTITHMNGDEQAAYEVDASQYGDGSIGAALEFTDGVTVTGYYVPDADRARECPSGWECERSTSGTILRAEQGSELEAAWTAAPIGYQSVYLNDDGSAGVVVWNGPAPQYGLPRFELDLAASSLGEPDSVDEDDVAEMDAIWKER